MTPGGIGMDIRKYEVFLAVVDRGSFIKAANDLGYTQLIVWKKNAAFRF